MSPKKVLGPYLLKSSQGNLSPIEGDFIWTWINTPKPNWVFSFFGWAVFKVPMLSWADSRFKLEVMHLTLLPN